ncbi:MAG: O-antigen ligase family protein [Deltaproteobacteria bacterium]|nr:O-antigen ligase family protein [Deltaproteobacteria bacterium]
MAREGQSDTPSPAEDDFSIRTLVKGFWVRGEDESPQVFWACSLVYLGIGLVVFSLAHSHANSIESLGVILVLLGWLADKTWRRDWKLKNNPLHAPLALVVVTTLLSLLSTRDPIYSLNELRGELCTYVPLFYAVADFCTSRKRIYSLIVIFLVDNLLALLFYAFLIYLNDFSQERFVHFIELSKFYSQRIHVLSTYFLFCASFFYAALYFVKKKKEFLLIILPFSVNLYFLSLAYQRAVVVAMAAVSFVPLLFFRKAVSRRALLVLPVTLAGLALLIFVTPMKSRLIDMTWRSVSQWQQNMSLDRSDIDQERILWVVDFWKDFTKRPLFGVGYGKGNLSKENRQAGLPKGPGDTHNTFTNVAAQTGLQGLAALLYLLFMQVRLLLQGVRRATRRFDRVFFVGSLCYMLGFWLRLQANDIYNSGSALVYWIMIGLAVGLWRLLDRDKDGPGNPGLKQQPPPPGPALPLPGQADSGNSG